MEIKKVGPQEKGQELFDIDNAAFIRDFDLKARSIQEEVNYVKRSEVYVAYEDNKAIGFIAYENKKDFVEIMSVAVIPEQQKKGVAQKLFHEILPKIRGREIRLVTHPKNTPAIILYLKYGFEIYGWKDNYFGDGEPRLLLERNTHRKKMK